jgi:HEAT repeat protein
VRRPVEESAEAAIAALASLRSQPGVEALKKAALSRSKPVREAARAALERLKAGKP